MIIGDHAAKQLFNSIFFPAEEQIVELGEKLRIHHIFMDCIDIHIVNFYDVLDSLM